MLLKLNKIRINSCPSQVSPQVHLVARFIITVVIVIFLKMVHVSPNPRNPQQMVVSPRLSSVSFHLNDLMVTFVHYSIQNL